MAVAEVILLIAAVAVPLLLGAALGYIGRPWWWGAIAAVIIFLIVTIAPEPEAGEPRVEAGDLGFLLVVAAIVAALTWMGAFLGRRAARRRTTG